ncbi:hypothetical protein ACPBEI_07275 [Latilactobacillus sakei]
MKKRIVRGTKLDTKSIDPKAPLFELVVDSSGKVPVVKFNGKVIKNKKKIQYLYETAPKGGQLIKVEHYDRDVNGEPFLKTEMINSRMDDIFD